MNSSHAEVCRVGRFWLRYGSFRAGLLSMKPLTHCRNLKAEPQIWPLDGFKHLKTPFSAPGKYSFVHDQLPPSLARFKFGAYSDYFNLILLANQDNSLGQPKRFLRAAIAVRYNYYSLPHWATGWRRSSYKLYVQWVAIERNHTPFVIDRLFSLPNKGELARHRVACSFYLTVGAAAGGLWTFDYIDGFVNNQPGSLYKVRSLVDLPCCSKSLERGSAE